MYATIAQAVVMVLLALYCFYLRTERVELQNNLEQVEQANANLVSHIAQMQENYDKEKKVLLERHQKELEDNVKYEEVIKYVYKNTETNATKRFNSVLDKLQFDQNNSKD